MVSMLQRPARRHSSGNMLLVGAACLGLLGIGLVATPLQAHADDVSTGLVAHWAFDEATAGSPAVDSVGGNNGTPIQGIPTDLPPTEDRPVATYPEPSEDFPPAHGPFSASFNGGNYFSINNPAKCGGRERSHPRPIPTVARTPTWWPASSIRRPTGTHPSQAQR